MFCISLKFTIKEEVKHLCCTLKEIFVQIVAFLNPLKQ